jgi:hypothetical protein
VTSLPRLIGAWTLVIAAAAAGLAALDRLPALIAGTPHGARVFASVEEAERAVGARIRLPGYYPEDLRWPPTRIEVSRSVPPTVVIRVAGRDGARERLVVAQCIRGTASPPPDLLPPGQAMETTRVQLGSTTAHLVRVLLGPRELHDVWWDQRERRITLRYTGPVRQLLLMAESLEREYQ